MSLEDRLYETIAVYDRLGATYADRIAKAEIPQLAEFAALLPVGGRVLDVGCAAGRDSQKLRDLGFEVHGIDLARTFLEIADREVPGVYFYDMDARDLRFGPEQFDGIWAHAVLLNLSRDEVPLTLAGFRKALRRGGICLVAVKEGEGEKLIGEELVNNLQRRETYFAQEELEQLFVVAGFNLLESVITGDELGRETTRWLYVTAQKPGV